MGLFRPIRRGQLIAPFGVGAMVEFRGDETLMTAGLDEWPFAHVSCPHDWLVVEERLQKRLGVSHFRIPPEFREPGMGIQHAQQRIPFVRFPQWHYCPFCGTMAKLTLFSAKQRCFGPAGTVCAARPERRRAFLVPVRFVAVCPKGHIEDFPFVKWAHAGKDVSGEHRLRLLGGRSSAGLSGMKVSCSCGLSRSMAGSFDYSAEGGGALHRIEHDCAGARPWLGETGELARGCGQYLRVVPRGGSNVYFPSVTSAIYLPLWAEGGQRRINQLLDEASIWQVLTSGLDEGRFVQKARCEMLAAIYKVDTEELRHSAQRKLDGTRTEESGISEEAARRQEYEALREGRGGTETELFVTIKDSGQYGTTVASFFERVGLVHKLRETRVLTSFSRLLPQADGGPGQMQPIVASRSLSWLPAVVIRGEGVFFEFSESALGLWGRLPVVRERVRLLEQSVNRGRRLRGLEERSVTATFVLLHTFAHLVINQLSFDCGYGSAALRERIYCEADDMARPMRAVLVYTASGDSDGTLGGLVRQGEPDRLPLTIDRALRRAQWCSADPVCIETRGQGNDGANLAACHGCALLPETSCEQGNRLLDRALVIGTPASPDVGFFADALARVAV